MVGILSPFLLGRLGLFSGTMLVLGSVFILISHQFDMSYWSGAALMVDPDFGNLPEAVFFRR